MAVDIIGLLWPLAIYVLVLVLHIATPARWVDGYVTDKITKKRLRYRLNGLRVFVIVILLYVLACNLDIIAWDVFYVHRWSMAISACTLGLLFSIAIVVAAPQPPGRTNGFLVDLYLGRLENPQWGGGSIDAKMYLYLVGAVLLELNVLSYAGHHINVHEDPSTGVFLYVAMFTFFVAEYLNFEEVHLYTYDFFAECVGFKLGWGCLVFYPFFYNIGLWATAHRPNPGTPPLLLMLYTMVFVAGWCLSRGANMQKFLFKTRPTESLLGVIAPESIGTSDGRRLLVSGFWGLSRHINYLGEILMATGIALSLGYPLDPLPWLYPLYYVAMLLPRQHEDDIRCAAKYGALWKEYCARVPYRVVPWVY